MAGRRSYRDPCGVARGLDLVGERWALLVVRELLFGPRRFTDLRAGLPGASPNVLSQRLDELQESGVVRRRRLPPPAASWVYELTGWGRELEDVLVRLGAWGARAPAVPAAELTARALMLALKTTFDPAAAGSLRGRFELRLGEDTFRACVRDGRLELNGDRAGPPDAVIEASGRTLRAVVFGDRQAGEALQAGDLRLSGDQQAALRFLGLFGRPQPAGG